MWPNSRRSISTDVAGVSTAVVVVVNVAVLEDVLVLVGDLFEGETVLSYERLDVYQCAIRFLALSARIVDSWPRGNAALVDQLKRAALSIPLNVAEAAGKTTAPDRARFYAVARGSAMECAAVIEASKVLGLTANDIADEGKALLVRIVKMLSKMCR